MATIKVITATRRLNIAIIVPITPMITIQKANKLSYVTIVSSSTPFQSDLGGPLAGIKFYVPPEGVCRCASAHVGKRGTAAYPYR